MKKLLQHAEDVRLKYMYKRRNRSFISMTFGLLSLLAGAAGFAWFFLMEYDIAKAVAAMAMAVVLPAILGLWTQGPVKAYRKQHKTVFMPKMAKAGLMLLKPSRKPFLLLLQATAFGWQRGYITQTKEEVQLITIEPRALL